MYLRGESTVTKFGENMLLHVRKKQSCFQSKDIVIFQDIPFCDNKINMLHWVWRKKLLFFIVMIAMVIF